MDTIAETMITSNLFMNNKFDLAEERMAELYDLSLFLLTETFRADKSMYHALGYNTILFIKAMLTCDKVRVFPKNKKFFLRKTLSDPPKSVKLRVTWW